MNKIEYEELITFHPGYYIKDYIDDQGITQEELAKRLQITPKYMSELVNGKINLTEELVQKLATVFGTSTTMWLNLNQRYIEKKIEIENRKAIEEECHLVKQLDYKFWVDLGLVKSTRDTTEKVRELRCYFKVASLHVLSQRDFLVQYRTSVSEVKDINIINANAWVQTAINIGSIMDVEPYDESKLSSSIAEIRSMTNDNPKDFYPRLKELLSKCGVALVLLPNLKNCGVNGAVKWLNKEKVVLALNDRRKYADTFWFALFHELGHVLQKRIKVTLVSDKYKEELETNDLIQKLEKEADLFSRNTLIPENEYLEFVKENKGKFTANSINEFAKKIDILPGIVVGRLQQDHYLNYQTTLNNLKIKYVIS
ncbi:HigA family addiction module antitoxin [Erysipelatoclostridium sp. AM42-17]|uniref:HigA family addiction module antitoxin n=1 Tax=Erysipelatoclostridium sp. AM42-17 TaxID=2293102 RepID=UPI000E46815A|nr:HigA family addiction module antitoxin [Erysipelatoclostridium sp. AM42-17]RHS96092.1 addiction module antidote protein, HigA family [Erysipelatoclostridium sp. AM42-17]